MDKRFALIAGFDELAALLVFLAMGFRVLDHLLDVVVGKTAGGLDADLLLLAGALVLGGNIDDAIGVDIEGHLDLRHAARRRRNAHQVEAGPVQLVVRRPFHVHPENTRMVTAVWLSSAVENTCDLLGRDGRVAVDQPGEHAAERLDTRVTERRHVEQQHVLDVALQDTGLDRRTDGHHFIRIDAFVGLAAEELFFTVSCDLRHAGHAADQDNFRRSPTDLRPASLSAAWHGPTVRCPPDRQPGIPAWPG